MSDWVIETKNLKKIYQMGEIEVRALDGVDIQIERGSVVSIMGPSGSGKSTLMNLLGCLDRPSEGEYILDGEKVAKMKDDQLADVRNRKVGFVFQSFKPAFPDNPLYPMWNCRCGMRGASKKPPAKSH